MIADTLANLRTLQRGALRGHWDEVVYLDAPIERSEERGIARDAEHLGGRDAAARAYASRYMVACRIHLAEEDPLSRASIVVEHDDPEHPRVVSRTAVRSTDRTTAP